MAAYSSALCQKARTARILQPRRFPCRYLRLGRHVGAAYVHATPGTRPAAERRSRPAERGQGFMCFPVFWADLHRQPAGLIASNGVEDDFLVEEPWQRFEVLEELELIASRVYEVNRDGTPGSLQSLEDNGVLVLEGFGRRF